MANNNDTDTGTGGINLNGDLYTIDVVKPNSPEDSSGGKQGVWTPGQVTVDKTIKDISTPTRETFAKYLSNSTLGKAGTSVDLPVRPNPYPIGEGDGTKLQETSLKDPYGNPMPPGISPNESKFAPEFNLAISSPSPLPLSRGYTSNATGKPNNQDGNSLLRNATKPADPDPNNYIKPAKDLSDPLKSYIFGVLKNNRFNPVVNSNIFIPDYLSNISLNPATTERYEENSSFVSPAQLNFGVSLGNDDKIKREYGFRRLARIAPILQQNATFFNYLSQTSPSLENSNSSTQGSNRDAGTDFALPIERINIESIINNLSAELIKPEEITNFGSKFETVLNNLVDRFTSFSTESQVALATALISAVFKAYETINGQIGSASLPAGKTGRYGSGGGRQGIGTYFGGPTEATSIVDFMSVMSNQKMSAKKLQFLNIRATSRPFRDAVMGGMQAFFNLSSDSNAQYAKILRPTKNVNYTVVLARSIIRATTRMALELKEINDSSVSNNDEKTYASINIIKDSRLIGIFNFFAHVGDIGLSPGPDATPLYNVAVDGLDAGRKISMIDAFSDAYVAGKGDFAAKHGKSRLFQGKVRKLAWAINQTQDSFLKPKDQDLKSLFGASSGMISKDPTSKMRMETLPELSRIPTEIRNGIESLYESEYVPFYFHDIRTNEILGFHAFITSLTDDYAANYESLDGFGRIEPVKIYKSTQRKIGVSFIAAALDTNDFDDLWYKINKLTTLVYPQFTEGKKLSNSSGNFQFTKPFTQAVGASPMIRIRLGNVFRSNYSKYNLSKIFGLDNPETVIMGNDWTGKFAASEAVKAKEARAATVAAPAEAKKRQDAAANDTYNVKYAYIYVGDGDGEVSAIEVFKPQPPAGASKNSEPTPATGLAAPPSGTAAVDKYVTAVDQKKEDLPRLSPSKYLLVCRVKGVAANGPNDRDIGQGAAGDFLEFTNIDPAVDYSTVVNNKNLDVDAVFKVAFEKLTLDDYYASSGINPDLPPNDAAVLKLRDELKQKLTALHAQYDKDVIAKTQPDITKYEFIIYVTDLTPYDDMTELSRQKYDKDVLKLYEDVNAAEAAAKQASDQQAIIDAAAEEERKKSEAEGGSDPVAAAKKKYLASAESFMKSDNNSIVKSFRSAGGRGLAGFIDSMSFDWMAGTWDTSDGRKAPKMCKVTISFTPIHDITPGLDANGQNRAPIYPIGPYSTGE